MCYGVWGTPPLSPFDGGEFMLPLKLLKAKYNIEIDREGIVI